VNTQLQVLAELLIELFEIFGIFTDFLEEFKAFLSDILLDNFQNLVVLEILSAYVER